MQYYSTISEAIENSPKDKLTQIFVHPGVYNESILVDRPVTLVGAGQCSRTRLHQVSTLVDRLVTLVRAA